MKIIHKIPKGCQNRRFARAVRELLIPGLIWLALVSCNDLFNNTQQNGNQSSTFDEEREYQDLERKTFNAYRYSNGTYYTLEAVRLTDASHCIIWAERSSQVSVATAEAISKEFEEKIFPRITGVFGRGKLTEGTKLTLLLLDIQDGYQKENDSYTAGYFAPADMPGIQVGNRSNNQIMIYMDTKPGKPGSQDFYTTIAHELQHCINFSISMDTRIQWEDKAKGIPVIINYDIVGRQEVWLDEGLSAGAEYIYRGQHFENKTNFFNACNNYYLKNGRVYPQSRITLGNNFYRWDDDNTYLFDDYVTVYLFFQWLRIQAGGTDIYRDIVNSPETGYKAVTNAAARYLQDPRFSGADAQKIWEELMKAWLTANYVNAPKGSATELYGYKGELKTITAPIAGTSQLSLAPGEGVYSRLEGTPFTAPAASATANIRYTGIDEAGKPVVISGTGYRSTDWLLTFNANWNNQTGTEKGQLTGREGLGILPEDESRTVIPESLQGPFPIDRRIPYNEGQPQP